MNMHSVRHFSTISHRCCDTFRSLNLRRNDFISCHHEGNHWYDRAANNSTILSEHLELIERNMRPTKCSNMNWPPSQRTDILGETRNPLSGNKARFIIRAEHNKDTIIAQFAENVQSTGRKMYSAKRAIIPEPQLWRTGMHQKVARLQAGSQQNGRIDCRKTLTGTGLTIYINVARNETRTLFANKWTSRFNAMETTRSYGTASATTVLQEMPEPRGLPVFGTMFSLLFSGQATMLHEYVDMRHKELGPVYRERIGSVRAVFVNSPDDFRKIFRLEGPRPKHLLPEAWLLYNDLHSCRRGLFFMEGDEWQQYRRIMNKLLLKPESEDFMIGPCREVAEGLAGRWELYAKRGVIVPGLENQLYEWSIEVMLATLLGSTWSKHRTNIMAKSKNLAESLHKIFIYTAQLSLIPAKLAMNLRLPAWKKFVASIDDAMGTVHNLVQEMGELNGDGLMSMLIEEDVRGDVLVRIVADLILAAGDTTAYSTQWALFLLGIHPNAQDRLFECLTNLEDKDIIQTPLLKGVLKESLRLYPTAPFLTRYLPDDSIIGGYHVRKGELLLMSLYSSGRDSSNFKEPDKFIPERWVRNERGDYDGVVNPHATLPFALGARSCIGRKLAEIQMTLTLAKLIQSFKIECINKDRVKMILQLVSVPSEPVQLQLTSRSR